jgi:ligand-binding sensor domain-containing protein
MSAPASWVSPLRNPCSAFIQGARTAYGQSSPTLAMLQDRSGRYWFATWEGIVSYDGKTFTNLSLEQNLEGNRIFSLLEDRAGNLWFGTIGHGLYRYDGKKFTHFTRQDGLADLTILCMLEDRDGNLWLGTTAGLNRYDGQTFTHFTTTDGLAHNVITAIEQDQAGKIWLASEGGNICFYEGGAFKSWSVTQGNDAFHNVRAIHEDQNGQLWLGAPNGLYRYDGHIITLLTSGHIPEHSFIADILEDRQGHLWFSSSSPYAGAVSRYNGLYSTYYSPPGGVCVNGPYSFSTMQAPYTPGNDGLIDFNVYDVFEDQSGNIWFCTARGVCRYDGKTFTDFRNPQCSSQPPAENAHWLPWLIAGDRC